MMDREVRFCLWIQRGIKPHVSHMQGKHLIHCIITLPHPLLVALGIILYMNTHVQGFMLSHWSGVLG